MAKASWVVVNPGSGSGNASVAVSSDSEYTGRTARSSSITVSAANCEDCIIAVNQSGKPEFVENTSDTATCPKAGATVTITGTSNSTALTFSIGAQGNTLNLEAPDTYNVGGTDIDNGDPITGDPGANSEYTWSVAFVIPLNDTISEKSGQVIVTDHAGNTDTCTITQAAGDPRLSVDTDTINLTYQGTAVSFNVSSNTSWTIS